MREIDKVRLGLIPLLAERSPSGHIGRTALMKYMYFLQTLRGLRLGYQFSLYSYGPFDSDVLADLSSAEAAEVVRVTPVQFSGGYGFEIRPGAYAETAKRAIQPFLAEHQEDFGWLFASFGTFNSAQLELASTIVYVDRELADAHRTCEPPEITNRVHEIKPHFSNKQIDEFVSDLSGKGILTSVRNEA